ncbi:MAG: hypothetical protein QG578_1413 [Thermodesulfobacteriota bacterium]|nr:hypothetical protein [Thermodesulfobacteriota bacterium]
MCCFHGLSTLDSICRQPAEPDRINYDIVDNIQSKIINQEKSSSGITGAINNNAECSYSLLFRQPNAGASYAPAV